MSNPKLAPAIITVLDLRNEGTSNRDLSEFQRVFPMGAGITRRVLELVKDELPYNRDLWMSFLSVMHGHAARWVSHDVAHLIDEYCNADAMTQEFMGLANDLAAAALPPFVPKNLHHSFCSAIAAILTAVWIQEQLAAAGIHKAG